MSHDQPKPPESENPTPDKPLTADPSAPEDLSAEDLSPEAFVPDSSQSEIPSDSASVSIVGAASSPEPPISEPPISDLSSPEPLSSEALPPETAPEIPALPEPADPPKPANSKPTDSKSTDSADSKAPTTLTKFQAFWRLLKQLWGIWLTILPVLIEQLRKLWQLILLLLKWIRNGWAFLLPKIRPILPEPFKTRLPNSVLTAIAITIFSLSLWLTSALFFDKPAIVSKIPDQVSAPETNPPATAPRSIKPPTPNKIAAIQAQMATVTDPYSEGLIQTVQVNFRRSRLFIQVGNGWYTLTPSLQDKLANDALKRSHKLKFDQLEIADSQGNLLARSPVVGSNMVILQREPLA